MDKQGSSFYQVINAVKKHDLEVQKTKLDPTNRGQKITMHFLKLKSNSLRNNGLLVDGNNIMLTFNGDGIAQVKLSDRVAIEDLMMARPGRFSWVMEEIPPVIETSLPIIEEDPITVELREALALEALVTLEQTTDVMNIHDDVEIPSVKRGRPANKKGK